VIVDEVEGLDFTAADELPEGDVALPELVGQLGPEWWEGADSPKRRVVEVVADRFQAMSPKQAAEAAA